MISNGFQHDAAALPRRIIKAAQRAAFRPARDIPAMAVFDGRSTLGQRQFVLKALIEEFGGEVMSSTLGPSLIHLAGEATPSSDHWLRDILAELRDCHALTLETHGAEVIVRISAHGAALAYGLPG